MVDGAGFCLCGLTVLVVDDNPDVLELLEFQLSASGARVLKANSAEEALRILDADRPNVILSDLGMPEMDGWQFIQVVRSRPENAGGRIPAIAFTGFTGDEVRARALAAGFQDMLIKPASGPEIMRRLRSVA